MTAAGGAARPIVIVDYHKGNLRSVERGLAEAGGAALVSDDPAVWGQSVHDHTNWTKIVDAASVDSGNAEQSIPSRLFRGRYLKVMIAGSNGMEVNNGVMKGCIAEIKVYGKSN